MALLTNYAQKPAMCTVGNKSTPRPAMLYTLNCRF
jgi:hypothetical protein